MPEMEIDEQSLFDAAVSDEPVEVEVREVPEAPEPEAQPRDEQGKFAKVEDEPEKPAADPEKPVIDDNAPQVPSWRVREINDEKRALAEKVAALEAERINWQRQQEKPAPKVEVAKPDPLLDPEGYEKYLETKFEERLLNNQREASLATAHRVYKQEFEEAYAAAQKAVDPALKARMQQSRDPGETLMEWHRELKTRAEVGSDLKAYKEKLRKEALEDPEFRKAAMEAWRTEASTQTADGRPRVNISPSLNGASRSNALLRSADGDVSDHELFNEITG
jgi:hypothetical protein